MLGKKEKTKKFNEVLQMFGCKIKLRNSTLRISKLNEFIIEIVKMNILILLIFFACLTMLNKQKNNNIFSHTNTCMLNFNIQVLVCEQILFFSLFDICIWFTKQHFYQMVALPNTVIQPSHGTPQFNDPSILQIL